MSAQEQHIHALLNDLEVWPIVFCNGKFDIPDTSDSKMQLKKESDNHLIVTVPDHTEIKEPLFISNYMETGTFSTLHSPFSIKINLGKNSSLTVLHWNDSHGDEKYASESSEQITLESGAHLNYYRMQNFNDRSSVKEKAVFRLLENSTLKMVSIDLSGGEIEREQTILMDGKHAETNVFGLYLADKQQRISNTIRIEHLKADCISNEMFKGILDDQGQAIFNGHVKVHKDASKTVAMQNNRNILLSDKAKIDSQPFLEIYTDDVKCSHGSSTGQLDENALFYMRSRGISEHSARTLLTYAFAEEILRNIDLPKLKNYTEDIIKKRLRGEQTSCRNCVLRCSQPEKL